MSDPKAKAKDAPVSCQADTSGCRIENINILIEKRAYELYEARGKHPGHNHEDWLQAEREIKIHLGLQDSWE